MSNNNQKQGSYFSNIFLSETVSRFSPSDGRFSQLKQRRGPRFSLTVSTGTHVLPYPIQTQQLH